MEPIGLDLCLWTTPVSLFNQSAPHLIATSWSFSSMSSEQTEPDVAPLPRKLKLNQPVDAPSKKHGSHARIKLDAPPKAEVAPVPTEKVQPVEEKKTKKEPEPKERSDKRKARFDELGEVPEGSGESWFSGATKWFIIFLVCMFGSMLFVWYIGGPDEST